MKKLTRKVILAAFILYHAMVIYVCLLPASRLAEVSISDKSLHFAEFFILGTLTFLLFLQSTSSLSRYLLYLKLIFWGLFMATLTETLQLNVPGRVADVWDFAANMAGFLTAFLACFILHIRFREKKLFGLEI